MRVLILSLFIIINKGVLNASQGMEREAILIEDVLLKEDQAQFKALLKDQEKKDIILLGQARAVSVPSDQKSKVVQIVWTGIKGKGKKRANFKEPFTSTFKYERTILPKGLKLKLLGKEDELKNALQRLTQEEEDETIELKGFNPSSASRRLDDMESTIKKGRGFKKEVAFDQVGVAQKDVLEVDGASHEEYAESRTNSSSSENKFSYPKSMRKSSSSGSRGGFNPASIGQRNVSQAASSEFPTIEVEVTKEGCSPRIDLNRGKVFIQTRSITRKNGAVTHETACSDSHLIFDIKKDYECCSDKIDEGQKVAFTTFKRYYLDEGMNKVYLDAECIEDTSQRHPFIEERGRCTHEIDLINRFAYPQAETIYYDRSNARKVVRGCHRFNLPPIPILQTKEGCALKHLLEEKRSSILRRDIFIENGITHEVTPCSMSGEFVNHEFVKAGCKPIINGAHVTPMAKRQITYNGKKKIISHHCEPQNLTELLSTREGCMGKYEHDLESGRSYPLVRFYYNWGGKQRFIDKVCRRSNEVINHSLDIMGYEHSDEKLHSKPRYQVYITENDQKQIIQEYTENQPNKWIAYTLEETLERPSLKKGPRSQGGNIIFENDRVELWKRPDDSFYEKIIGKSTTSTISIAPNDGSGKTIVSVTEQCKQVFNWSKQTYQNRSGNRVDYYVRKLTKYSDGSVKVGGWEIRIEGDNADKYALNQKTRNLFGVEPELPSGLLWQSDK